MCDASSGTPQHSSNSSGADEEVVIKFSRFTSRREELPRRPPPPRDHNWHVFGKAAQSLRMGCHVDDLFGRLRPAGLPVTDLYRFQCDIPLTLFQNRGSA
jgi:hypothetical protein